jgi:hypothetical protein
VPESGDVIVSHDEADFSTVPRVVKIVRGGFQSKRRGADGEFPRLCPCWMLRQPYHHPVCKNNVWLAPDTNGDVQRLTITIVTLLEVDGDPKRIHDAVPSLEDDPSTRLKDATDEEQFEPILKPGEREQDSGESCDGRFFDERVGDVCEVR